MRSAALVVAFGVACRSQVEPETILNEPRDDPHPLRVPDRDGGPIAEAGADASQGDGGLLPPHGGLSPEEIRRVVVSHSGALRACWDNLLKSDSGPASGELIVAWDVDASGAVTRSSVVDHSSRGRSRSTLQATSVAACVLQQIDSWRFPASSVPTAVAEYPFRFGVGPPR